MTVTLTAPINEAEYRDSQMLALAGDFTGDKVVRILNAAWQTLETWAKQPLSSTANTEVYQFPGNNCNATPEQIVQINPNFTPLISVTSLQFSESVVNNGWTVSTKFDIVRAGQFGKNAYLRVYDSPLARGDHGICQLVYTSGFATIPEDLKEACRLMAMVLWSAGFYPTQGGAGITPEWVYGADQQKYYRIRQTMDAYMRKV